MLIITPAAVAGAVASFAMRTHCDPDETAVSALVVDEIELPPVVAVNHSSLI
jgi:hypothetical protein